MLRPGDMSRTCFRYEIQIPFFFRYKCFLAVSKCTHIIRFWRIRCTNTYEIYLKSICQKLAVKVLYFWWWRTWVVERGASTHIYIWGRGSIQSQWGLCWSTNPRPWDPFEPNHRHSLGHRISEEGGISRPSEFGKKYPPAQCSPNQPAQKHPVSTLMLHHTFQRAAVW